MAISKNRLAIYHMKNNSYLGECLSVIYVPSSQEIKEDHLKLPLILRQPKSFLK